MTNHEWIKKRASEFGRQYEAESEGATGWDHESHGPSMTYVAASPVVFQAETGNLPPEHLVARVLNEYWAQKECGIGRGTP